MTATQVFRKVYDGDINVMTPHIVERGITAVEPQGNRPCSLWSHVCSGVTGHPTPHPSVRHLASSVPQPDASGVGSCPVKTVRLSQARSCLSLPQVRWAPFLSCIYIYRERNTRRGDSLALFPRYFRPYVNRRRVESKWYLCW